MVDIIDVQHGPSRTPAASAHSSAFLRAAATAFRRWPQQIAAP
jgi:hypothetical protein